LRLKNLILPIKETSRPLYQNITIQIEALIRQGRLPAGEKLPPEREMAKMFGVSRTCMREALKSLATKGLVKVIHGRGVFVSSPPLNGLSADSEVLWSGVIMPHSSITDLFEIRKLLEPAAAAWAAERRTDAEAAAIMACVKDLFNDPAPNLIKVWEADTRFHMTVIEATHNAVLVRIMHSILDFLAESRKNVLDVEGRPFRSVAEHLQVAQSIMRGDRESAAAAMMEHVSNVENAARKNISDIAFSPPG